MAICRRLFKVLVACSAFATFTLGACGTAGPLHGKVPSTSEARSIEPSVVVLLPTTLPTSTATPTPSITGIDLTLRASWPTTFTLRNESGGPHEVTLNQDEIYKFRGDQFIELASEDVSALRAAVNQDAMKTLSIQEGRARVIWTLVGDAVTSRLIMEPTIVVQELTLPPSTTPRPNPEETVDAVLASLLEQLDLGLPLNQLEHELVQELDLEDSWLPLEIYLRDLTNDGKLDAAIAFVYEDWGFLYVLAEDDSYQVLHKSSNPFDYFDIEDIRDLNNNGKLELIYSWNSSGPRGGTSVFVTEWEDFEPIQLVSSEPTGISTFGSSLAEIADRDGDGFPEIIMQWGSGVRRPGEGVGRKAQTTWKWDGEHYVEYSTDFEEPTYRFQAVLDGDYKFEKGKYDEALNFYQQAVFDTELLGWNPARFDQFIGTPTAMPSVGEYSFLNGYSRFRIMLIHLVQRHNDAASTVYERFSTLFEPTDPGYPFSQLAAVVWEAYRQDEDLGLACTAGIAYVEAHEEQIRWPFFENYRESQPYVVRDNESFCPFVE